MGNEKLDKRGFKEDRKPRKDGGRDDKPRRPRSNFALADCKQVVRDSENDIAWYSRNPQLIKDTANLSYGHVLGLSYNSNAEGTGKYTIPGIAVLDCYPTIGVSESLSSAVNQCSRLIYSFIRHKNSGSRNYEAPDYMTYILAVDSAIAFYHEMARLYGLTRVYNVSNRYIAKPLIRALGYDYDDITSHLADFRAYINTFAVKLNSLAVPKQFYLFDRHAFITNNVWKDSADDKAQLYAMRFTHYYKWDGTQFDTGSALIPTAYIAATFLQIKAFGDSLLEALLANEDIGLMSGDTLKAFGENGCHSISGISEDYACIPKYDEMVLAQIHNANIMPRLIIASEAGPNLASSGVIFQDTDGNIISKLFCEEIEGTNSRPSLLLDCGFNSPTPEYNMEATRLKACFSAIEEVDGLDVMKISQCGTEIVQGFKVLANPEDSEPIPVAGFIAPTSTDELALSTVLVTVFDWAPIRYWYGDPVTQIWYPIGELFNYTILSLDNLAAMHECALLSLLEVPGMAEKI